MTVSPRTRHHVRHSGSGQIRRGLFGMRRRRGCGGAGRQTCSGNLTFILVLSGAAKEI